MMNTVAPSKLDQAKAHLRTWLKDGPRPAKEIEQLIAGSGISSRLFDDAKADLNVSSVRRENVWWWEPLPGSVGPPGASEPDALPSATDQERAKLEADLAAAADNLAALTEQLPDLAADPDAFQCATQRRRELEAEYERLSLALVAHDRRVEAERRQREQANRDRLQAEFSRLETVARQKLADVRAALAAVQSPAEEYREIELERHRLAAQLGRRHPFRATQVIEGVIYDVLQVGDGRGHRDLAARMYPEEGADV